MAGEPAQPGAILDHLLAGDVGPRARRDDVALLCLRNTVDSGPVHGSRGSRPAADGRG